MSEEQLAPLLRELAEKLGTTADHLWEVMVSQAYVYGVTVTSILVVLFVIMVVCFFVSKRWYARAVKANPNDSDVGCYWIPFGLSAIAFVFSAPATIYDIITAFMNPEYWALQDILKHISGG